MIICLIIDIVKINRWILNKTIGIRNNVINFDRKIISNQNIDFRNVIVDKIDNFDEIVDNEENEIINAIDV